MNENEKLEDFTDEYGIDLWVLFEKKKDAYGWQWIHTTSKYCRAEMELYAEHLAEKFPGNKYIMHYYQSVARRGIIEHERNPE